MSKKTNLDDESLIAGILRYLWGIRATVWELWRVVVDVIHLDFYNCVGGVRVSIVCRCDIENVPGVW